MDWEGKIITSHLTCSATSRTLMPGESFFSALVMKDGLFQRLDFSSDAWSIQEQSSFLSWWRQKILSPENTSKPFKLNSTTLYQLFTNMKDARTRSQQCLVYVIALALVRARKFNLLEVYPDGNNQILMIQDRTAGLIHRVRDPHLDINEESDVLNNLILLTNIG